MSAVPSLQQLLCFPALPHGSWGRTTLQRGLNQAKLSADYLEVLVTPAYQSPRSYLKLSLT